MDSFLEQRQRGLSWAPKNAVEEVASIDVSRKSGLSPSITCRKKLKEVYNELQNTLLKKLLQKMFIGNEKVLDCLPPIELLGKQ